MAQVVIDDPVLNSPFVEPTRHFKFSDQGITGEIADGRRSSAYFVPIAAPKKAGGQAMLSTQWTADRIQELPHVNRIRQRVGQWREGGWLGVTPTTHRLLKYWTDDARDKRLFFCQIEALETVIYVTEVAQKYGDGWIENQLRLDNEAHNPGLQRMAVKMATGTGKTIVMAMLIAWHVLNKVASPHDARFADAFLLVAPGLTIKDRLRVLLPGDPGNYYRQRDIVPAHQMDLLGRAKIVITNFHAFLPRERGNAASLTKRLLAQGGPSPFTETPDQVVRRVCRELGANKRNIVVINDEAHHCYQRKPDGEAEKLTGEELFRNDDGNGGWISKPNTILVDSRQLESEDGMSADFKQAVAREIEEFKSDYLLRFPGRDTDNLTDEDLLREVMNTVGKPGKLGEHVRCVVSVTIDTSRVALALARTRLMVGKFTYYLLSDSPEGIEKEAELTGQRPPSHRTDNDIRKGFVCKRVPHVTLKSIANNPDIKEGLTREQIDAAITRHAETENLHDKPYEDGKRVRVSGPFTVESLSPHRVLAADENMDGTVSEQEGRQQQDFTTMILDNLRAAGVQNTKKGERLKFDSLEPWAGSWIQAQGTFAGADGKSRRVAVAIGPEHGTVGPGLIKDAAKEAVQGALPARRAETCRGPVIRVRPEDVFRQRQRHGQVVEVHGRARRDVAHGGRRAPTASEVSDAVSSGGMMPTSCPRRASSLAMRFSPQVGFSRCNRQMRHISFRLMSGRPSLCLDFRRQ